MCQAGYFLCWQASIIAQDSVDHVGSVYGREPHDGFDTAHMIIAILAVGVHALEMCHASTPADNLESHATYQDSTYGWIFRKALTRLARIYIYIYIYSNQGLPPAPNSHDHEAASQATVKASTPCKKENHSVKPKLSSKEQKENRGKRNWSKVDKDSRSGLPLPAKRNQTIPTKCL